MTWCHVQESTCLLRASTQQGPRWALWRHGCGYCSWWCVAAAAARECWACRWGAGNANLRNQQNNMYPTVYRETTHFFKRQVLASNAVLHYLLPERRDNDIVRSLRNSQPFPSIRARTNKFNKSFLPYCLINFT